MDRNPIAALQDHAALRPHDSALWFGDDTWTYERFARESARLARGLVRVGLKRGDRVVLHVALGSSPAWQIGALSAHFQQRDLT